MDRTATGGKRCRREGVRESGCRGRGFGFGKGKWRLKLDKKAIVVLTVICAAAGMIFAGTMLTEKEHLSLHFASASETDAKLQEAEAAS